MNLIEINILLGTYTVLIKNANFLTKKYKLIKTGNAKKIFIERVIDNYLF